MKYYFEFGADLYYKVEVESDNLKDAFDKADDIFSDALSKMDDEFEIYDSRLTVAEDKNERYYDYGYYSEDWVQDELGV